LKILGIFVIFSALCSCSVGNCRSNGQMIYQKDLLAQGDAQAAANEKSSSDKSAKYENPERRIFVYKQDGGKQCEPGTAISLNKMARELKNIKIFSKKKGQGDGFVISLCGAHGTGINVFEIGVKDLEKAKELGFLELTGDKQ
jgi:hypothetical protein